MLLTALLWLVSVEATSNKFWVHRGNNIRYIQGPADVSNSPVLCVHGFGGNADQFRKNIPTLSKSTPTFAIDLLGYGYSDKPSPRELPVNQIYNFENWGDQLSGFIEQVIQKPSYIVANSVGGVAALQAAATRPDLVKGVILINISMRMLHIKKQSFFQKPIVSTIQKVLRETDIGRNFFKNVATPTTLRNILNQAYGYQGTSMNVDDETIRLILEPGLQPGAAEVFLDFISYSGGPLPEELLPKVTCPVRFLWGVNDPWEPMDQAKELYYGETLGVNKFSCVDEFVMLPGGGHCPMDQVPELVNTEVLRFLQDYAEK